MQGMVTIYVDSRKRVSGSDSNFTFELPETLRMQSSAKTAVYKVRIADAFLSTDRGRNLYWIDVALGTLNTAQLPVGAYTGARLAAWISSNYAAAVYQEATNAIELQATGIAASYQTRSCGTSSPTAQATPWALPPPIRNPSIISWEAVISTGPSKSFLG